MIQYVNYMYYVTVFVMHLIRGHICLRSGVLISGINKQVNNPWEPTRVYMWQDMLAIQGYHTRALNSGDSRA